VPGDERESTCPTGNTQPVEPLAAPLFLYASHMVIGRHLAFLPINPKEEMRFTNHALSIYFTS
jgi:hypothetical protein